MYIAGCALRIFFVVGRITEVTKESVELEDGSHPQQPQIRQQQHHPVVKQKRAA